MASEVIHYAQKPVLLVRLGEDTKKDAAAKQIASFGLSDHILFPTDFSKNADQAFQYLSKLASVGVKQITLLHVQDQTRIKKYLEDRLEEFNQIDLERLQNLKKLLEEIPGIEVHTAIKYGHLVVEILKVIQESNVQLVLMGSQGRGFVKELFLGSVSHNIVRQADASVLLIPALRED
ncbi:Universal stress protein [Sporotomaculum syntrophicum]|uniref:Universal stress protein n=1 Tax=Sporotomaculum syntrophicum TaxID=182264 RepID=A0A9D2WRG4_9FIRM|nr:universal stress protein [Sporotomaculum syntrophicum]KAF1085252.1 Universal stress protein [Sporotomaculum syntrophicum]